MRWICISIEWPVKQKGTSYAAARLRDFYTQEVPWFLQEKIIINKKSLVFLFFRYYYWGFFVNDTALEIITTRRSEPRFEKYFFTPKAPPPSLPPLPQKKGCVNITIYKIIVCAARLRDYDTWEVAWFLQEKNNHDIRRTNNNNPHCACLRESMFKELRFDIKNSVNQGESIRYGDKVGWFLHARGWVIFTRK